MGRVFTNKLRESMSGIARMMQSLARGFIARRRYKKTVEMQKKVTKLQAMQRGRLGRKKAVEAADERKRQQASMHVSRLIVGHHGRLRYKTRKQLLVAARSSSAVVGPMVLFPSDVRELASRIEEAVKDPIRCALPAALLGLIRIIVLMLGGDKITVVSATGAMLPKSMKYANDIQWEDAMRVLRRTAKFLRRLRTVASGPAARRPRLLQISKEGLELHKTYKLDPQWK
jgi:hypothetical protein